jgi:hypothetical protein
MKTGTCYFPSYGAALRYYRPYYQDVHPYTRNRALRHGIDLKLNEGAIHIGKPPVKPGETLTIEDNRYHITEAAR